MVYSNKSARSMPTASDVDLLASAPTVPGELPTTGLLDLPNEIIILIAESFDPPKGLFSLLRANRRLANLLRPVLKRLTSTHSNDIALRICWAAITADKPLLQSLIEIDARIVIKRHLSGGVIHEAPGKCEDLAPIVELATTNLIYIYEGSYKQYGGSGLHWAAKTGGEKLAELFLDQNAPLEIKDSNGKTPLDLAAMNGHAGIVRLLLEKGADRFSRARFGETPLHKARDRGHMEAFGVLLEEGSVPIKYKDGAGLLHLVAAHPSSDDVDVVELLLRRGAGITDRDDRGRTPLYFAIVAGNRRIAKLLLDAGADANNIGTVESAISLASKHGHIELAKILFNMAPLNFLDSENRTPLHLAIVYFNYDDVVPHLLGKGFNVNVQDKTGTTPLHLAALAGKTSVAALLLKHGADVNAIDKSSRAALHLVAARAERNNERSITKLLLDSGADVNIQDAGGMTVLHHAVLGKNKRLIRLLIEARPDRSWRIDGSVIKQMAIKSGDSLIISLVHAFVDAQGLKHV